MSDTPMDPVGEPTSNDPMTEGPADGGADVQSHDGGADGGAGADPTSSI
jgi:hypothetical protein